MRRKLFTVAAILSAVVFVATCVLWVRLHGVAYCAYSIDSKWEGTTRTVCLDAGSGRYGLWLSRTLWLRMAEPGFEAGIDFSGIDDLLFRSAIYKGSFAGFRWFE